jgi:hypothetical protein
MDDAWYGTACMFLFELPPGRRRQHHRISVMRPRQMKCCRSLVNHEQRYATQPPGACEYIAVCVVAGDLCEEMGSQQRGCGHYLSQIPRLLVVDRINVSSIRLNGQLVQYRLCTRSRNETFFLSSILPAIEPTSKLACIFMHTKRQRTPSSIFSVGSRGLLPHPHVPSVQMRYITD